MVHLSGVTRMFIHDEIPAFAETKPRELRQCLGSRDFERRARERQLREPIHSPALGLGRRGENQKQTGGGERFHSVTSSAREEGWAFARISCGEEIILLNDGPGV
jgi:hypothetical protein